MILFLEKTIIMKINIHTHKVSASDKNTDTVEIVNHIIKTSSDELQGKYISAGIHPWYIDNPDEQLRILEEQLAVNPNIIAVGEAGLDKLRGCDLAVQCDIFEKQILLAERYSKPLIIHCVKAFDELLALKKRVKPSVPWIVHGFRGNHIQALQLVKNGLVLSFGPIFNHQALKAVWNDVFFLETDDNDYSISGVYKLVADTMNMNVDELESKIEQKFLSLKLF